MNCCKHVFASIVGTFAALLAVTAATPAIAADKAVEHSLFEEGKALWAQGKHDEACAKFAASNAEKASVGASINAGRCEAERGNYATAWANYKEAVRLATIEGREPERIEAAKQVQALEPKLSYLTLVVEGAVSGEQIFRDEQPLDARAWGSALPIDPGKHVITAKAPGYLDRSVEVRIGKEADRQTITVPALESAPEAAAPVDHTLAYIVGGAGVAVALGGLGVGIGSAVEYGNAKSLCGDSTMNCPTDALDKRSSADTLANVSNVMWGVGAAAIIGGVVLYFTAGKSGPPRDSVGSHVKVTPVAWSDRAGVLVSGEF